MHVFIYVSKERQKKYAQFSYKILQNKKKQKKKSEMKWKKLSKTSDMRFFNI